MNRFIQVNSSDAKRIIQFDRLAWLWLLIGFFLLPFTAWQGVIPLAAWLAPIFLLRFARNARQARIALPSIFAAYAAAILIDLRGLEPSPFDLIVTLIVMPLFRGLIYTLPYAFDRVIGSRVRAWPRLLVFPLAFTTVDWAMPHLKSIGTFGSPAYSQYDNLVLTQIISITGMWGLTFLIMWFASTVNALWEHNFHWRPVRGMLGLFAAALLATFLFGSVRLNLTASSPQTIQAATITIDRAVTNAANTSVDWAKFDQFTDAQRAAVRPKFAATVDQMLARTETALRGGAKIVGWQEASALVLEEDKQSALDRASALARQYDAYLQICLGVLTRAKTLPFLRNQSILIDNTGHVVWTYDKTYPVAGSEAFGTIAGSGVLPVANSPYGRLSTAICNDAGYPALIRQAGQNGVDILFAPTNDITPYASADSAEAIYRSIENGFSMVRATGNGVSLITDYEGRVLGSQDYFTSNSGIMLTTIPTHGVTTLYSRIGDVFAYLCVVGLILLTGWALVHREQALGPMPVRV